MHNKYIFTNVIGTFVFNEHFNVIDNKLFKNNEQYDNKYGEKEFLKKYTNLKIPEGKELNRILGFFKKIDHFKGFYEGNLRLTKADIKASVKDDLLIVQAIGNISEIDKSISMLIRRLREWYAMYNPEFEDFLQNQEKFIELVLGKSKKELLKEIKVNIVGSMGADFSKEDLEPVLILAKEISSLYSLKEKQEVYLEKMMKKVCPNLLAITGATIGAKLIGQAGDLKRLMLFPASTIQLLGAEKALFRHMKTKARAPKYGFLHEHPLISKNKRAIHGKIARTLADKISIAVKVDYFKGKFIGDKLLKEIEAKFK